MRLHKKLCPPCELNRISGGDIANCYDVNEEVSPLKWLFMSTSQNLLRGSFKHGYLIIEWTSKLEIVGAVEFYRNLVMIRLHCRLVLLIKLDNLKNRSSE